MIKITVVEETKEVILRINGVDVPIDEIDYIDIGAGLEDCENENANSSIQWWQGIRKVKKWCLRTQDEH